VITTVDNPLITPTDIKSTTAVFAIAFVSISANDCAAVADVKKPAILIPMERVDVSSSNIREKIKMGKDCRNLLPKRVFDYIIKRNLYGSRDLD
jgi:nicotinic acid mononucleotide adenylyltransferase